MHSRGLGDLGDLGSVSIDGSLGEFFLASSSSSSNFLLRFSSCIFCSTPTSTNKKGRISCDKLSINVAWIVVSLARMNTIRSMSYLKLILWRLCNEYTELKTHLRQTFVFEFWNSEGSVVHWNADLHRNISVLDFEYDLIIDLRCLAKCSWTQLWQIFGPWFWWSNLASGCRKMNIVRTKQLCAWSSRLDRHLRALSKSLVAWRSGCLVPKPFLERDLVVNKIISIIYRKLVIFKRTQV